MKYKGIVLTGTSGAGKSSVAAALMQKSDQFKEVRALTTREKRPDDKGHYIYIDDLNFKVFGKIGALVTETEYRGKRYGITKFEVSDIINRGLIPILTIAPASVGEMKTKNDYLSFFIDATDDELDKRLLKRDGSIVDYEIRKRRKEDRKYEDDTNYLVYNKNSDDLVDLIIELWRYAGVGGTLSKRIIQLMVKSGMLLKNAKMDGIQGASYDLTLADEYYYSGKIRKLDFFNSLLKIEPYDYAIVSCKEDVCMPKDVTANFGLTVSLFCQGIILSNGQQVDPGFRGTLFCLLFNTSDKAVTIKRGSHYATIEFHKMLDFTDAYKGKNQNKREIISYIPPNVMYGAINQLKKEMESLKEESKKMQTIYTTVLAIIVAAVSVLLAFR